MRATAGIALCLLPLAGMAGPATLQDFAYAAELGTEGEGPAYALSLPETVYAGLTRADLGDLRVFNANDQLVPSAVRLPPPARERQTREYRLPLFPLYAERQDHHSLEVLVRRGGETSELRLSDRQERPAIVTAYLLDAREVPVGMDRLSLDWAPPGGARGLLTRADLEASDDLEHWRPVASGVTLADLEHQGEHLRRDRVPMQGVSARYLRLRLRDPGAPLALTGASARGTTRATRITVSWREAEVRAGPTAGEYVFDNPGPLRVSRLRVVPPEVNTLARAMLYSRPSDAAPWQMRRELRLYRLRQRGLELSNPDVPIASGASDPHWRLVVDQSGGGLGSGLPEIRVAWRAHRLVFLARGPAPYTVAWGSARVGPPGAGNPLAALRPEPVQVSPARLIGEVYRPGGGAALRPAIDWRRALLWGVLMAGAGLLVWMALRLFRQMNP